MDSRETLHTHHPKTRWRSHDLDSRTDSYTGYKESRGWDYDLDPGKNTDADHTDDWWWINYLDSGTDTNPCDSTVTLIQLLEMYDKAIASVNKLPASKQEFFKDRLKAIRDAADGIGWGYHAGLGDSYAEAFE